MIHEIHDACVVTALCIAILWDRSVCVWWLLIALATFSLWMSIGGKAEMGGRTGVLGFNWSMCRFFVSPPPLSLSLALPFIHMLLGRC